ncbi:MAG: aromatic aminobenezylarsenical efflux permease ArsG family transporter [Luteolibacter sp.]|jgi:cytochrome c-type biogenesis protein
MDSNAMLLAIGGAFWLGVLTSVSPCPMATNIAAIGYLARNSHSRMAQLAAGLLYAIGRAVAYTLVGALIAWGLLSAPVLSNFLQKHLGQWIGPLLVLVGMVLLGLLPGLPSFGATGGAFSKRVADMGVIGSGLLGFLFALAFCPVSAALFFGSLLPLAIQQQSTWLLPAVFGIGSALPVLIFGILLTLARQTATRAFGNLQKIDRWLLPLTGWLLVGIGLFLIVRQWFF